MRVYELVLVGDNSLGISRVVRGDEIGAGDYLETAETEVVVKRVEEPDEHGLVRLICVEVGVNGGRSGFDQRTRGRLKLGD